MHSYSMQVIQRDRRVSKEISQVGLKLSAFQAVDVHGLDELLWSQKVLHWH